MKGEFIVGYTVQGKEYWAKKLKEKSVIGDRCVMFNKKSEFNFKAITDMDCYIIRKPRLYDIFSRYPEIA
jgi:hypothetical protein